MPSTCPANRISPGADALACLARQFDALTDALTTYGQETLGCRTISPPWLSFYIDGCEQQVHADVPQGPLAYVLSLTRWDERSFTGGETTIMQPHVLDYWHACSL